MHFGAVAFFDAGAWRDGVRNFDAGGLRNLLSARAVRIEGLLRLVAPGSESHWPRWAAREATDVSECFQILAPGASHTGGCQTNRS